MPVLLGILVPLLTLLGSVLAVPLAAAGPAAHAPAAGTTFHVRPDGGTAAQCTGRADRPYPGHGTRRACAWAGPLVALPPGGRPLIEGGDTLLVHPGSYRMGFGAPGTEGCDTAWTYDCHMPPVPSGPSRTQPTRILGTGHADGCSRPPELWGTERASRVINLEGSDNVEVSCLEITDHDQCVELHGRADLECRRDSHPHGDWASTGIYASDSSRVTLRHLDVHGLAHTGIHAGRLSDWRVDRVRVAANGWVGWDGDLGEQSSNSGRLRFSRWLVEWNGCGETWPQQEPIGCWGQTAGGYGDGVGTAATGGTWRITRSVFRHNTSDGLDLLYHSGAGRIVLDRVRAEGNAGNQLKTRGDTIVRNTVVVADCDAFAGQPYTHHVDDCRAAGDAVALVLDEGDAASFEHNTVLAGGNCILVAEGSGGASRLAIRNNVLLGGDGNGEGACYRYVTGPVQVSEGWNVVWRARSHDCPGRGTVCRDPRLADDSFDGFDPRPRRSSPAVDTGHRTRSTPKRDHVGTRRPVGRKADRGAVERR